MIKSHIAGCWCGSGDRGGNGFLSPYFHLSEAVVVLPAALCRGRWDSAGAGAQRQCCPGDFEAQPDPLQHDPWLKVGGGRNSAFFYIVEMHLLLYRSGESVYQQYITTYVFCKRLGGCLQDQACEAQSERAPMCFDSGTCILHMHSLFTHGRPEEWRFVAHPASKVT